MIGDVVRTIVRRSGWSEGVDATPAASPLLLHRARPRRNEWYRTCRPFRLGRRSAEKSQSGRGGGAGPAARVRQRAPRVISPVRRPALATYNSLQTLHGHARAGRHLRSSTSITITTPRLPRRRRRGPLRVGRASPISTRSIGRRAMTATRTQRRASTPATTSRPRWGGEFGWARRASRRDRESERTDGTPRSRGWRRRRREEKGQEGERQVSRVPHRERRGVRQVAVTHHVPPVQEDIRLTLAGAIGGFIDPPLGNHDLWTRYPPSSWTRYRKGSRTTGTSCCTGRTR